MNEPRDMLEPDAVMRACMAQMNAGFAEGAEAELAPLLAAFPDHPGALCLAGLIASGRRDWRRAEDFLRRALEGAPGQPRILLPLAQVLEERGDAAAAEQFYCQAWLRGGDPTAALGQCRLLLARGSADAAEPILRQALAGAIADPDLRAQLEHHLALSLQRRQAFDEALQRMRAAAAQSPLDRRAALERASLLRRLGQTGEAIAVYENLLAENPLDLDTHLLLSELRNGLGEADALSSYEKALQRAPGAAQLPRARGRLLLKLGSPDDARLAFETALALSPGDPGALAGLARALELGGDASGAHAAHAASIATSVDGDALEAFGAFLLRQGDVTRALPLAERATQLRPESQGAWALLGLCLRGSDDPRAEWLDDHERHVRVFDLAPPEGYADMASFNRALAADLARVHAGGQQYLTQTLRGGTQTHEEMFYNGNALVDRLLPRITEAVQRYIAEMADDPSHPLSSRRGRGFRYAGSWSSQLSSDGFHVNHIHQKGWISSCYYVAVPDAAADAAAQAGWLKFGEPPEEFGAAFPPRRTVQPLPGRLVLFPSYMWHGTIAFRDPQKRLTIAFDAIPA